MVKNKKGGSGHKKMARKNVKPTFIKRKLRKPEDPLEIFARVTSIHGGGHADVYCQDKKTRLLVIRGKFRGRNKRDNSIKPLCKPYTSQYDRQQKKKYIRRRRAAKINLTERL